jgi:hypothetical protein
MEKIYLEKNIFCIKNFFSEKSFNALLNFCKNDKGWINSDKNVPQRFLKNMSHGINLENDGKNNFENGWIWDELQDKIFYLFPNHFTINSRLTNTIQKTTPYNNQDLFIDKTYSMLPHSDDKGYQKLKNNISDKKSNIAYGLTIYLNNNFKGGEIFYTKKNIKVKIEPNMLVCHPGSDDYEHGVMQIYENSRYSIPFFLYE